MIINYLGGFFPELGWDSIFSTQGIMVGLLAAYATAMWMFLKSAPKVYTIMVSDLTIAKEFYEGLLNLSVAEVPLHYYYNYDQAVGTVGIDPMYLSSNPSLGSTRMKHSAGLWYQLKSNSQLHVITGANVGQNQRQRHVCFDRDCLEQILVKVQSRNLKYKIRTEKPLNFLVKDLENRVIEVSEVNN